MGFKGSLESINLADIFQNLAMNQQTGTLRVADKSRTKCIYFQRGEVRFLSHGKRKIALLGEMLIGRGLATREQVDAALAEQRQSNRLLGEIVVALSICTREDVDNLVRFQIEEEIYDLFGWEHAEFEFTEGPPQQDLFDAEQQATELSINTSSLIMEAARRIDEWERIRHLIPSTGEVFVRSVETLPEAASPVTARVLTYLDGARDIDSVVEDSHFSRFEVASSLAAMLEANQIRPAGIAELSAGAARCMADNLPARAVRLMEQALALGADEPGLREQLANACGMLGEKEKAAIHLGVLGDEKAAANDHEAAAAAYERIVALLPRHASAHEKLAKLRAAAGDKERALKHYTSLVQTLIEFGRLDEAATKCREGLLIDGESIELRSALAKILMSSGEKNGAIEEFERLAEILNRAGQMRPAADVFRRILQIDPTNKHAKRRLSSLLSGAGIKRESHAVRSASIVFFVLMLGGAVYIVIHELAALKQYEDALNKSRELLDREEFDEARRVLGPVVANWSLFDRAASAQQQLELANQQELAARERIERLRKQAEVDVGKLLAAADEKRAAYEFEEAAKLYAEVTGSQHATAETMSTVSATLKQMAEETSEVDAFLQYKERVAKEQSIAALKEEYDRTVGIRGKYRRNPRLQSLQVPVLITTNPGGAEIYVDRAPVGKAPTVIRYPVGRPPEVGVRLLGYGSVDRVEISNTVSIEVKLHRAVSWRYDAGSAVRSMAMGPAKTLLVATRDGLLAAVDVGTAVAGSDQRSPAWVFRTNEPLVGIQSGIAVFDAQLYFGTSSVYALDLGAGIERRWAVPVGGRVMAPVTAGKISLVAFGDFVFGTCNDARGNGTVWAIDNAKGVVHWRKQPSESKAGTKASALQQGAQLYVPFEDGKVYSFEATNGNVLGTWQVGSAGRMSSLVMSGGMAWIATGEGKVHALDLENPGRPARTFDSGWPISTDLAVRDGIAYFGDQRGNLTAVDLTTLKRVWEPFTGDGSVMGSLAVTDTTVYFGTSSGWVFAVERGTGALAWKYRIGQEIVAGAFFEGRYLCVGAADGFVYGFDEFRMPEAP